MVNGCFLYEYNNPLNVVRGASKMETESVVENLIECRRLVRQLRKRLAPVMMPSPPPEDQLLPLDLGVVPGLIITCRDELKFILGRLARVG